MNQALTLTPPLGGLRDNVLRIIDRLHQLARAYPREFTGVSVLTTILFLALAISAGFARHQPPAAGPPAAPPLLIKQIAPDQAVKVNAAIPLARGPNPSASPFAFKGNSTAKAQALECLTSAVYYEAGNQGDDGKRAVAQVVLNRVRHPAFPGSVCGVVYQGSTRATGCQFTFTCDGSLGRGADADGWRRAREIASAALAGAVYEPVGWATHYHADYVVPYWASSMAKNAIVGAHIFYRWSGGWGQPAVFSRAYAGLEPTASVLRAAALATPHVIVSPVQSGVAEAIADIPGAEAIKLAPSMRGNRRVAVRFNLVARKASEQATHEDYQNKFAVSDNLKWSLSGDAAAVDQAPLGKPRTSTEASTASGPAVASAGH